MVDLTLGPTFIEVIFEDFPYKRRVFILKGSNFQLDGPTMQFHSTRNFENGFQRQAPVMDQPNVTRPAHVESGLLKEARQRIRTPSKPKPPFPRLNHKLKKDLDPSSPLLRQLKPLLSSRQMFGFSLFIGAREITASYNQIQRKNNQTRRTRRIKNKNKNHTHLLSCFDYRNPIQISK